MAVFFLVIFILFKRQITSLIAKASRTKVDLDIDLSTHGVKSESHQIQKEADLMSFMCVYCDQLHPMSCHSLEHIIPRALGNKNYVLPNACKFINNYMACSFEKRIINSEVMKEIQLIAYPPKNPYFRRNLGSSIEPHLAHYIFPTGENKKVQKPHDIEIDTVPMQLFGEKGKELTYELKLPFSIIGVKGATALISSAHLERRLKKFNPELENYVSELFKNPSINPGFFDFIKDHNINLDNKIYDRKNRKVIPKIIKNSPLLQTDNITIFFDDEALTKFFFKIAWTYAAQEFGREKLTNSTSEWILDYLVSGHVNDIELVAMYPDLFLEPTKIDNEEYIFWKYDIKNTLAYINENVFRDDLSRVMKHYNYRLEKHGYASNFIRISKIELLDDTMRKCATDYRHHELSFKKITGNLENATVCLIKLYGGILEAEVLLSEEHISINFPPLLKIDL